MACLPLQWSVSPSPYALATDGKLGNEGAYKQKVRNDPKRYRLSAIHVWSHIFLFNIESNEISAKLTESVPNDCIMTALSGTDALFFNYGKTCVGEHPVNFRLCQTERM